MERNADTFAAYLAKQLIAKQNYKKVAVPEANELNTASDIVLGRAIGGGFEMICLIDGEAHPQKRFELSVETLEKIGKDCLKYSGKINRTQLPVVIKLIEVRNPVAEADRHRLAAVKRWGGFSKVALSAWLIDPTKCNVWTSAHFNGRLIGRNFFEKLLREPRESDAQMFETQPAVSLNVGPPYVTYAILALLIAVFGAECLFAVTPLSGLLSPGAKTLFAFGGLSRPLVLESSEWYRLFTAPLLHGNLFHLVMNGIALFFAGRLLEAFVGRTWFAALFVIGGLGGSLLSIAINPPNIVSVGASGAIMALAASALTISVRLGPGIERTAIQTGLLQIIIPSLIPLATHGGQVDYAAHLGGAITGVLAGLMILLTWSRKSPQPALRQFALAITLAGVAIVGYAAIPLSKEYQTYTLIEALMPKDKIPANQNDAKAQSANLVAKYPRDPRTRVYRALALSDGKDLEGAEQQLRLALAEEKVLNTMFKPELEGSVRTMLAAVLIERGNLDEAKRVAQPVCAGRLGATPPSLEHLDVCGREVKTSN